MNSGRSLLEFSCYEMNYLELVIQWKRLIRFQDAAGRNVKLCLQMILSTSGLLLWEIKKWQKISPNEPNFWQCMNLVLHHGWRDFYCSFLWINIHEPTVKKPTHGVSYLNHSNPLFHVQLTPSLTSFALGVNFPETLGSMWCKSYIRYLRWHKNTQV